MISAPQGVALGSIVARLRRALAECCTASASSTISIMRRWLPWSILVAGVVLAFFSVPLFTVAVWDGHKTLEVYVEVIDTDVPQAVSGAEVTIFDGAHSPIEGRIEAYKPAAFNPDPKSPYVKTNTTDSNGICRFRHAFSAGGRSGIFQHSGSVYTSDVWIRVSAPGRPSTLVSLQRRSAGARDVHDETPVFVTVVLNKCGAD